MQVAEIHRGLPSRGAGEAREAFARRVIHYAHFAWLFSNMTPKDAADIRRAILSGFIERERDVEFAAEDEDSDTPSFDPALMAYYLYCLGHGLPFVMLLTFVINVRVLMRTRTAAWCLSPEALGQILRLEEAYERPDSTAEPWDVEVDEVVIPDLPVHAARELAPKIFRIAMDSKPVEDAASSRLESVEWTEADEWLEGVVQGEIPFPATLVPWTGRWLVSVLMAPLMWLARLVLRLLPARPRPHSESARDDGTGAAPWPGRGEHMVRMRMGSAYVDALEQAKLRGFLRTPMLGWIAERTRAQREIEQLRFVFAAWCKVHGLPTVNIFELAKYTFVHVQAPMGQELHADVLMALNCLSMLHGGDSDHRAGDGVGERHAVFLVPEVSTACVLAGRFFELTSDD